MPNTIDGILLPPIFPLFLFLCLVPSPSSSCTASPQHFHLSARVSLSNSLRRSPRLCQLSLPTCKRHKNLLKMHRFQSLFPLLPHSPTHPPSRHPLLFPPPLFSSYTFLSLSYNSTSLFVSLTVLNSSRVGMATNGNISNYISIQYIQRARSNTRLGHYKQDNPKTFHDIGHSVLSNTLLHSSRNWLRFTVSFNNSPQWSISTNTAAIL